MALFPHFSRRKEYTLKVERVPEDFDTVNDHLAFAYLFGSSGRYRVEASGDIPDAPYLDVHLINLRNLVAVRRCHDESISGAVQECVVYSTCFGRKVNTRLTTRLEGYNS